MSSHLVVLSPAPLWRHGQRAGAQQTPVSPIGLAKRRLHPIHTRLGGRKHTHRDTHEVRKVDRGEYHSGATGDNDGSFQWCSYFTWGMPEAGGCQVAVTTSVQVSSAAKTQPSSNLNIEMKQGEDRGGKEPLEDIRKGRRGEDVIYLRLGVKGATLFTCRSPAALSLPAWKRNRTEWKSSIWLDHIWVSRWMWLMVADLQI